MIFSSNDSAADADVQSHSSGQSEQDVKSPEKSEDSDEKKDDGQFKEAMKTLQKYANVNR